MKCNHCGTENALDAKYCFQCGKEIIPVELFENDSSSKVNELGYPSCGGINVVTSNFCKDRGTELPKNDSSDRSQAGNTPPSMIPQKETYHTSESKQCEPKITTRNDAICPYCKEPDCTPMQKSTTEINTKNYQWGSGCCGMFLLGPFGLLCGMCGTGSKVKTENELWWVCTKCGKQHISLDDAVKKWVTVVSALPISGVSVGIGLMILRIILFWIFGSGFLGTAIGVIASVILAPLWVFWGFDQFEEELAAQLGTPIAPYLTKDQETTRNNKELLATGIAIAIALLGIWLLCSIEE